TSSAVSSRTSCCADRPSWEEPLAVSYHIGSKAMTRWFEDTLIPRLPEGGSSWAPAVRGAYQVPVGLFLRGRFAGRSSDGFHVTASVCPLVRRSSDSLGLNLARRRLRSRTSTFKVPSRES